MDVFIYILQMKRKRRTNSLVALMARILLIARMIVKGGRGVRFKDDDDDEQHDKN